MDLWLIRISILLLTCGWACSMTTTGPTEYCVDLDMCPMDDTGRCIDGNLPNPYDCHSFCSCTNCRPIRMYCNPEYLVFHPVRDECVEPEDYPTCYASVPFTTPRPLSDVAICAVRRQEQLGTADPLPFDYTLADLGNRFLTNNTVRIPANGFFLNSISAAAGQATALDLSLKRNGVQQAGLQRNVPRTLGPDTASRDYLTYFLAGDELRISSDTNRVFSDGGHLTSWSLVSISELMSFSILFSASRSTSFGSGRLVFDNVLGEIGGGWNMSTYQVPMTGLYYFSLSTGVALDQVVQLNVYRNGGVATTGVNHQGRNTDGITTVSRSFMLSLNEGDFIWVEAVGQGFSNNMRLTSFSALLYNPYHGNRVAWSVVDSRVRDITERVDPLEFDTIIVNEGDAYVNHVVTCSISGYYYIHMSFASIPGRKARMELLKNFETQAHLTRDHEWGQGPDTYSRSLLLQCASGERMRIATQESSYDGSAGLVSFSGFLLFTS